jgi:hypothetical protein
MRLLRGRHERLYGLALHSKALDRQRVSVVGAIRVIDHAPAVVNGMIVPAWTELRVSEAVP